MGPEAYGRKLLCLNVSVAGLKKQNSWKSETEPYAPCVHF